MRTSGQALSYLPGAVCDRQSLSYLNAQHQESPGSPEWEIGGKGCGRVWGSPARSLLMTRSG